MDCLIAAFAIHAQAELVHKDSDFELISQLGELRTLDNEMFLLCNKFEK